MTEFTNVSSHHDNTESILSSPYVVMREELESGRNVTAKQAIEICKLAIPMNLSMLQSLNPQSPELVLYLFDLKRTIKGSYGKDLEEYCLAEAQYYDSVINAYTKKVTDTNSSELKSDEQIMKAVQARTNWFILYSDLNEQKHQKKLEDAQIKKFFTIKDLLAFSIKENKDPESLMIFDTGPFNIHQRRFSFEARNDKSPYAFFKFINKNIQETLTMLQKEQLSRKPTYALIQYLLRYLSVRDDSSQMLARTFCLEESYWYFERLKYGNSYGTVYEWDTDIKEKDLITKDNQSFWLTIAENFNPLFSVSNPMLPLWRSYEEKNPDDITLDDFYSNLQLAMSSVQRMYEGSSYKESLPLMGLLRNIDLARRDTSQVYTILFCQTMLRDYLEIIDKSSLSKNNKRLAKHVRCKNWIQAIELLKQDQNRRSLF